MKQMEGQISFEKDIPKVPIYHVSLTCVWNECPTCKNRKGIGNSIYDKSSDSYHVELTRRCPECDQALLWDWDLIAKATKYSGDYPKEARR